MLHAALEGLLLQKQRIEEQIREVRSLLGERQKKTEPARAATAAKPGKRRLSLEARARIAEGQKRRWAEFHRKSAKA
ncbi:MAG: hypothetical protein ACRD9L_18120 [Bryobacteraceae bacterium]